MRMFNSYVIFCFSVPPFTPCFSVFTRFRVFWGFLPNTDFCSRSRDPALHSELFPGERFPEVEWLAQRQRTFFRPGIHIAKFLSPKGLCHFSLPLTLLLIPFLMTSLAEPANRKLSMSYIIHPVSGLYSPWTWSLACGTAQKNSEDGWSRKGRR